MKQVRTPKEESILKKEDRKTSQGYVDLKSKTVQQLEELIERQDKLLQNRAFISKLPDKGEKILSFKSQLEAELRKRQEEYNSTCQLLSNLTLNDFTSETLEWNNGKLEPSEKLDSDDESDSEADPLKLIASHSGTAKGKKTVVSELNSNKSSSCVLYTEKFCEKYGQASKPKDRFKPNQLKNNDKDLFVVSAEKVKRRLGEKWEVTEATPPVPVFKETAIISLSESLKLQKELAEKLREIEQKNATERLLKSLTFKMGDKLPVNNVTQYRVTNVFNGSAKDSDEEEVHDPEGEEKEKSVYYAVDNDDGES